MGKYGGKGGQQKTPATGGWVGEQREKQCDIPRIHASVQPFVEIIQPVLRLFENCECKEGAAGPKSIGTTESLASLLRSINPSPNVR